MEQRKMKTVVCAGFLLCSVSVSHSRVSLFQDTDSSRGTHSSYDPFGPENSPDHNGQGSGGVITPSPYETVAQTYYTRISSDYFGIQYMLDSPWQFSIGTGWTSYQTDIFGILFKIRTSGFQMLKYDPVVEDTIPYYLMSLESSFEYAQNDKNLRSFKIRLNEKTEAKSLGMAGVGVLVSDWNLMIARDMPMDRKWEVELTWKQVSGGYIMPLSPSVGGVNIALCGAVDLFGIKYQSYSSERRRFVGAKIGSVGWLAGLGWNALSLLNLSLYVGGEWSFATGGLKQPTEKIVRADVARNSLFFGLQGTGRYLNMIGGIQKEWEGLDFEKAVNSEKALRYYFGANYYFQ